MFTCTYRSSLSSFIKLFISASASSATCRCWGKQMVELLFKCCQCTETTSLSCLYNSISLSVILGFLLYCNCHAGYHTHVLHVDSAIYLLDDQTIQSAFPQCTSTFLSNSVSLYLFWWHQSLFSSTLGSFSGLLVSFISSAVELFPGTSLMHCPVSGQVYNGDTLRLGYKARTVLAQCLPSHCSRLNFQQWLDSISSWYCSRIIGTK